uniref:Secreted protein n=1 Tax=Perkinsus chesapeaki TaxID=330153 RepID=A7YXP5_PERCH|nr:unknown [Perkinsus chesapeaki]
MKVVSFCYFLTLIACTFGGNKSGRKVPHTGRKSPQVKPKTTTRAPEQDSEPSYFDSLGGGEVPLYR